MGRGRGSKNRSLGRTRNYNLCSHTIYDFDTTCEEFKHMYVHANLTVRDTKAEEGVINNKPESCKLFSQNKYILLTRTLKIL